MENKPNRIRRYSACGATLFLAVGFIGLFGSTGFVNRSAGAADPTSTDDVVVRIGSLSLGEGGGSRSTSAHVIVRYSASRPTASCIWWHTEPWGWSASGSQRASGALAQTLFDGSQDYMTLGSPNPRLTKMPIGANFARIAVRVFPDAVAERDEAFAVVIDKVTTLESGACSASSEPSADFAILGRRGIVTIMDDDTPRPQTVEIGLTHTASQMVASDDALFVIGGTFLTRIDASTNANSASVDLGILTNSITFGAGSVWVGVGGDEPENGAVIRIDPTSLAIQATIENTPTWSVGPLAFANSKLYGGYGPPGGPMQVMSIDPATNIRTRVDIDLSTTQFGYSRIIQRGDDLWMIGHQPLIYNTVTNRASGWPSSVCPDRPFEPYGGSGLSFSSATFAGTDVWVSCQHYDNYRDGHTQPGYLGRLDATDLAYPGAFTRVHDLDPSLFGWAGSSGAMTYLEGTIWMAGADSTVVGHSMRRGYPSVTYVVPLSHGASQLLNAFGNVWAIGGQTVTRIVPEPSL